MGFSETALQGQPGLPRQGFHSYPAARTPLALTFPVHFPAFPSCAPTAVSPRTPCTPLGQAGAGTHPLPTPHGMENSLPSLPASAAAATEKSVPGVKFPALAPAAPQPTQPFKSHRGAWAPPAAPPPHRRHIPRHSSSSLLTPRIRAWLWDTLASWGQAAAVGTAAFIVL